MIICYVILLSLVTVSSKDILRGNYNHEPSHEINDKNDNINLNVQLKSFNTGNNEDDANDGRKHKYLDYIEHPRKQDELSLHGGSKKNTPDENNYKYNSPENQDNTEIIYNLSNLNTDTKQNENKYNLNRNNHWDRVNYEYSGIRRKKSSNHIKISEAVIKSRTHNKEDWAWDHVEITTNSSLNDRADFDINSFKNNVTNNTNQNQQSHNQNENAHPRNITKSTPSTEYKENKEPSKTTIENDAITDPANITPTGDVTSNPNKEDKLSDRIETTTIDPNVIKTSEIMDNINQNEASTLNYSDWIWPVEETTTTDQDYILDRVSFDAKDCPDKTARIGGICVKQH